MLRQEGARTPEDCPTSQPRPRLVPHPGGQRAHGCLFAHGAGPATLLSYEIYRVLIKLHLMTQSLVSPRGRERPRREGQRDRDPETRGQREAEAEEDPEAASLGGDRWPGQRLQLGREGTAGGHGRQAASSGVEGEGSEANTEHKHAEDNDRNWAALPEFSLL